MSATATGPSPKPSIPGSPPTRPGRSVAQRLHLGEAAGLDVDATLRRAETMRELHRRPLRRPGPRLPTRPLLASTQRHRGGPPAAVPAWLAAAPPGRMPTPWDSYLPARYTEMDERITSLVIEATAEPARWLRQIGEGPGRDEAFRQVVAYRAVYAIDGDDPLGPEPAQHTRQHQAWSAAHHAIQASTQRRGHPAPSDSASCS